MARPTNITMCSFCGKSHAEVRKLISGPDGLRVLALGGAPGKAYEVSPTTELEPA